MNHRATVALVEWNWGGHNQTYFKHYLAALSDCGARVLPVMSRPDLLTEMFRQRIEASSRDEWTECLAPIAFHPKREVSLFPRRMAARLRVAGTFDGLRQLLCDWARRQQTEIDLVFFACMYDVDFPNAKLVSRHLQHRWAGLYLQGRAFHKLRAAPEARRLNQARALFDAPGLEAVGVLEPEVLGLATKAGVRAAVRLFPDIVEQISDVSTERSIHMQKRIRQFAAGRPVVALLGFLQPSKGVEVFLEAACEPRLHDVAFVLAGSFGHRQFSPETLLRIEDMMRRAPNLIMCLQTLSEGEFNAAVQASDILFASYVDFPYSSNVQVKAAQLHKPLIVTDGFLMADRCKTYALGECVEEGDVDSVVSAIRRLIDASRLGPPDEKRFDLHREFVRLNDHGAVHDAMDWILRSANL